MTVLKLNLQVREIDLTIFIVHTSDAIDLMHDMRKNKNFFNVVDLDPYGTAIPFLEGALSCISNGGLLAVTFTDMAVLCAR